MDQRIGNVETEIARRLKLMTPDPIIEALAQQVACYRKLAKLAGIQRLHIQNSATEALIDVLQKRQAVMEQLAEQERIIAPAKQRWSEYSASLSEESRAKAEELLVETRALLKRITDADRDDVLALQQRKLNLGRQIQQATTAKQVNRNYAKAAYGSSRSRMDLQT